MGMSKDEGDAYIPSRPERGEESGLVRWVVEHADEILEAERAAARRELQKTYEVPQRHVDYLDGLTGLDRAIAQPWEEIRKQERSMYRQVMQYLVAHPTPWRIAEGYRLDDVGRDDVGRDDVVKTSPVWEVRDANMARVLPPCEPSPQVEALVDFVNLVGEEHEPPCGWHTAYIPEEAEGGDGEDRRFSTRNDEEFLRRLGYTPPGSSDEN